MVDGFIRELEARGDFFGNIDGLASVYFGGGTPSVLSSEEIRNILEHVRKKWRILPHAEITLEANPEDLANDYITRIKEAGVNRLSIGIQSFKIEDLITMNRSHTVEQAMVAVELARTCGIPNVTCDLVFGLPHQSVADWRQNVETMLSIGPPHVSVYSLTIEDRTALAHQLDKGFTSIPDDEVYEVQFRLAHELLTTAGYDHYELSNYARHGYQARHNSTYWAGEPYLGIGPSAHSYDGQTRSWNIANNHRYLQMVFEAGLAIEDSEVLTQEDRYHEYLMLGLRTERGIDADWIEQEYVPKWRATYADTLAHWLKKGVLKQSGSRYWLSPEGWFVSDRITGELF